MLEFVGVPDFVALHTLNKQTQIEAPIRGIEDGSVLKLRNRAAEIRPVVVVEFAVAVEVFVPKIAGPDVGASIGLYLILGLINPVHHEAVETAHRLPDIGAGGLQTFLGEATAVNRANAFAEGQNAVADAAEIPGDAVCQAVIGSSVVIGSGKLEPLIADSSRVFDDTRPYAPERRDRQVGQDAL